MMRITVRFQKYLARLLEVDQLPVELDEGASVEALLERMRGIPALAKTLFKGRGLDYYYQLARNGSLLHGTAELASPLADGDEIYVFLTIGGG